MLPQNFNFKLKKKEMKNILLITIGVFLFISCDVIEKPFINIEEDLTPVEFPALDPDTVYRKLLFEEYTGHRCTNCPNAHDRVAALLITYGDTLIPIGIHAGSLAATNAEYPYDFTNPISVQLFNDFSIPFVPIAIVNRIKFSQNSWGSPLSSWQNHIDMVDRTKKYAAIQMINEFDNQTRELTAHAKVTILDQITDIVQLCFVIIEDDIVKPQLRDGIRIPEYNHKHVLRGSLNGNYGAQLTLDGIVEKDSAYQKAYKISFENKDWNEDNCYVVVYLINMETKEILQVEHLKVK
jgi:hypothetical protein